VSPTQLEDAAACPFRYFLRRGLQVNAIETGERSRDLWLDPLIRGSLLHDLYAGLLRRCRDCKRKPSMAEDQAWFQRLGQEALDDLERDMPPPSIDVKDRESRELLADLDLFLEAEEGRAAERTAVGLEIAFGRSGAVETEPLSIGTPVTITVGDLTFRVAGRVDRIDELAAGTFEILDYKTGGYWPELWKGTFAGGRRLQHALYGLAALELLKTRVEKPQVVGAQYYFSSTKGRQERKTIPAPPLAVVGAVLSDLRDVITGGLFVHTPAKGDCKFCDYGPACGDNAYKQADSKLVDAALAPYRKLAAHE
ncbi:MAG: PD-(D/E)XK nuclease family protein, partial [Acidobacteriota bacterium]